MVYRFCKVYSCGSRQAQNVNPSFMKAIFEQKDKAHNLRKNFPMRIPKTRTSSYEIESLSFLGGKLWNNLPDESIKTLASFKRQIKGWNDNGNSRLSIIN